MPSNLRKEASHGRCSGLARIACSDPGSCTPFRGVRASLNAFIAPSKTFTDLRRNASWWAPFLLMVIVISTVFVYTVDQKIGFRKVTDNQLQMSPKAQSATIG